MAAIPADVLVERLRGRENAKRLVSSSFMCNKMFQVRVGRYYTKYDVCNTGQPGRATLVTYAAPPSHQQTLWF